MPRIFVVVFALCALAALNMLMPALFIKLLIDDVFPSRDWTMLWMILGGIVGVYVGRNVLYFIGKYAVVSIGEQISFSLRNRLFSHLQQLNLRFYQENKAGKLSSHVMNDTCVIQTFIQDDLPTLLQAALLFIGLTVALYWINWQLAIASTMVLPLHLLAFHYFKRRIKHASLEAQEHLATVNGTLIEHFLGVEVVKSFGSEVRRNEAFERAIDQSRRSELKSKTYHVGQKVVADLLVGLGTAALLGVGAYQVIGPNAMDTGTFLAFLSMVLKLYPTVIELTSGLSKLTKSTASIDRVFAMFENVQHEFSPKQFARRDVVGHIRFESVRVRHHEGRNSLDGVTLALMPGEICALIGPSGSGKSTLASLIPRFVDPDDGRMLIDREDARRYELSKLRQAIGIAFQEPFLFNSTIMDNLRYACPDASMEQVTEIAERIGTHEMIMRLPNGYDTIVGDQGVTLSRGEKQRIALTRALLKQPRILILDEATTSMAPSESLRVMGEVIKIMKGRTVLFITHQEELLPLANRVIQMANGNVVFNGPPSELLTPGPDGDSRVEQYGELRSSGFWPALQSAAVGLVLALTTLFGGQVHAATPSAVDTGQLQSLETVTSEQAAELVRVVALQLQIDHGFAPYGNPAHWSTLSAGQLQAAMELRRHTDAGVDRIRMGFVAFDNLPVHLWIQALTATATGIVPSELLPTIETLIAEKTKLIGKEAVSPTVRLRRRLASLESDTITLGYVEADHCLALLKARGYQTVEYQDKGKGTGKRSILEPLNPIDPTDLPIVVAAPGSNFANLVGGAKATTGNFGISITPSVANELPNPTSSSPLMQLHVFYDPNDSESFSTLQHLIRTHIDKPARQILIEAMVLEISEVGMDRLGIQWSLSTPFDGETLLNRLAGPDGNGSPRTVVGRLPDFPVGGDLAPTLNATISDVFGHFSVKLQGLVRDGQAEILSKPSVLTLDNRQASIRVGEDIPVATSVTGSRSSDKLSFDFKYIPVGILLNVRPRLSHDLREVSLQIDGMVSAQVPGQDLVLTQSNPAVTNSFFPPRQELARAPRISSRRVQTYCRVANNTPFIIGGLISKDKSNTEDKTPGLSDIPVLGNLFTSRNNEEAQREVIIVITPYVLPDDRIASRSLPRDDDAFDSNDQYLFRDTYRLRKEDVFDLGFLRDNPYLSRMTDLANMVVARDFSLSEQYPFSEFVQEQLPGDSILLSRQVYEIIKRRSIDTKLDWKKIMFFAPDAAKDKGFDVQFLHRYIASIIGEPEGRYVQRNRVFRRPGQPKRQREYIQPSRPDDPKAYFAELDGQALALTYTAPHDDADRDILSGPVPEVRMVPCRDRREWERLLWEMNQPRFEGGPRRYTLLLQDARDVTRLKRALLMREAIALNTADQEFGLKDFAVGRQLLMPTVKEDKVYMVGDEVAKYFFHSELYYDALRATLAKDLSMLRAALTSPSIQPYIEGEVLPEARPVLGDRKQPSGP